MSVQISINQLSRHYRRRSGLRNLWTSESHTALHPLSLSIAEGQRVALVGPNGAGKSTLIKLLCGIIAPSSGELSILGRHHTPTVRAMCAIGVVFDSAASSHGMSPLATLIGCRCPAGCQSL